MGCEHLQQPLVLFVELAVAQHGQGDHAHQLVADGHRHGQHRLEDVVGARDLDREVHLAGIGCEERFPMLRDMPCDALADLGDQRLDRVLLVVGEHLAAERNRIQREVVRLQEVHAAAVVVDDRSELGGDRRADLRGVTQGIQLRGEAVEHVELRHRAESVGGVGELPGGLSRHLVALRHHVGSSLDRSSGFS